jgi:hypothetical protein
MTAHAINVHKKQIGNSIASERFHLDCNENITGYYNGYDGRTTKLRNILRLNFLVKSDIAGLATHLIEEKRVARTTSAIRGAFKHLRNSYR